MKGLWSQKEVFSSALLAFRVQKKHCRPFQVQCYQKCKLNFDANSILFVLYVYFVKNQNQYFPPLARKCAIAFSVFPTQRLKYFKCCSVVKVNIQTHHRWHERKNDFQRHAFEGPYPALKETRMRGGREMLGLYCFFLSYAGIESQLFVRLSFPVLQQRKSIMEHCLKV